MFLILSLHSYGQDNDQPLTTSLSFLLINPHAHAAGLGDQGVATAADDVYAQFWNPSKYLFSENNSALGLSYTPFIQHGNSRSWLSNISYYKKRNERSVWSGSINYFNYGEIRLRTLSGNEIVEQGSLRPNDFALSLSYSLLLNEEFGLGVSSRYIYSNVFGLTEGGENINTLSFDLFGYYQKVYNQTIWRNGFSIKHFGPRFKEGNGAEKGFLPTQLQVGTGLSFVFNNDQQLSLQLQASKLLIPALVVVDRGTENERYVQSDSNFLSSFFESFSDHPDGASGELKELVWSLGADYSFNDQFNLCTGYLYENEAVAGGRNFFSFGTRFKKNNFSIDLSYLINTNKIQHSLNNVLRFSVALAFDKVDAEEIEEQEVDQEASVKEN